MIGILRNERGVTLLEVLATAGILAVALISVYIGILYAEKQVQRDYHDRVAFLAASGFLDWEYNNFKQTKTLYIPVNQQVLLATMPKNRKLYGTMSVKELDGIETPFGETLPYAKVEATVTWTEPGDNRVRKVVVREDYFQ